MLRRHQLAAPDRCAEEQREGHLPTEHVMDFSGLVDDLVHRDKTKRYLAPVDDRSETAPGRSDADTGKGGLRDRRRISSATASSAASLYVSSRIVVSSPQASNTSSVACSGSGNGLASAKVTAASSTRITSPSMLRSPASSRWPWSRSCRSSRVIGSRPFQASISAGSRGSGCPRRSVWARQR